MNNDINEKIVHAAPVPPFVRFVASAVPMVFDNSLSYYEALCALWKWLQDDVIDVINNNATVTEHYIEMDEETRQLFIELKSYVDNYFDNLDVQEEINNKLDEMAEAGTLQEIITSYIQSNVTWTFDTVADMKAATNLVDGSYARTLGFHTVNDGGGALYRITNTGTANEMDVIAVDSLYANLVAELPVCVNKLGAYGDNTHNDYDVINYALSTYKSISLLRETYLIASTLTIASSNNEIIGDYPAKLHYTGNNQAILINSGDNNLISGLNILGNNSNTGIEFATTTGKADSKVENCRIESVATGIKTQYLWDCVFKNVRVINSNTPFILGNQTNATAFNSCQFTGFQTSATLTNCEGIKFDSCDIANYSGSQTCVTLYQSSLTLVNCYFEKLGLGAHIGGSDTNNSVINIIGGHATYNETQMPTLNILPGNARLCATNIQGAQLKILPYYSSTDKPAAGVTLKSLNLPEMYEPSMFNAVTYFDGTFNVTYTSTSTYSPTTATFANGVMTMQHGTNAYAQGVQFSVTPGEDYLLYLEGITTEAVPNLVISQSGDGSSGTYNRNIPFYTTNKVYIPIHAFGDTIALKWSHDQNVVFKKLILAKQ